MLFAGLFRVRIPRLPGRLHFSVFIRRLQSGLSLKTHGGARPNEGRVTTCERAPTHGGTSSSSNQPPRSEDLKSLTFRPLN